MNGSYYFSSREILNFAALSLFQLSETLKKFALQLPEDQNFTNCSMNTPNNIFNNQTQPTPQIENPPSSQPAIKTGQKRKQSASYNTLPILWLINSEKPFFVCTVKNICFIYMPLFVL